VKVQPKGLKVGILTSHPIQYQAPWFRALTSLVDLRVYFAFVPDARQQGKGFNQSFEWDLDLLEGYQSKVLQNRAKIPNSSNYSGCDTPGIVDETEAGEFDAFIVCGWYLKCYRQAMRACRKLGIPILVRGDSHLETPRSWIKRLALEFRQRWLLRQFDGFLSVGEKHTAYLRHYGVAADKITFSPHFVDNEWFLTHSRIDASSRVEARKRWKLREEAVIVLFVGKFDSIKRPLDLVKAARLYLDANSDGLEGELDLLFVGAGELESEIRSLAASYRVNAVFTGFRNQSEMPIFYAISDLLALPSRSETWGLVVNEAMACGTPSIVSNAVGCAPDLIEEGITGFTYPVGDVTALSNCLQKMAGKKKNHHDWTPALSRKLETYNVRIAVGGVLQAMDRFTASSTQ